MISALYGLTANIIDRTQFSLLITVVVLSAIVPTAIAQRWFSRTVSADQAHHLMPPDSFGDPDRRAMKSVVPEVADEVGSRGSFLGSQLLALARHSWIRQLIVTV
jgi:hypothetical protein